MIIGERKHTFPSRTRSLSSQPPMVVWPRCYARVGRCQYYEPRGSSWTPGLFRSFGAGAKLLFLFRAPPIPPFPVLIFSGGGRAKLWESTSVRWLLQVEYWSARLSLEFAGFFVSLCNAYSSQFPFWGLLLRFFVFRKINITWIFSRPILPF